MANWDDIKTSGDVEDRRGYRARCCSSGWRGTDSAADYDRTEFLGLNVPQSTVQDILSTFQTLSPGDCAAGGTACGVSG